jgi:STE24 endopeptidase
MYSAVLAGIVVLRAQHRTWWPLSGWAIVAAFTVFMILVWPVLIDPLYHRFTPVEDEEVRARAGRIAERAGIETGEILWIDAHTKTKRTNAYFTGLGATKRIVLYDTLKGPDGRISPEELDEIETILAHEAGHWLRGHMWKGTLIALAGMGAYFALAWLGLRLARGWAPPAALVEGARAAPLFLLLALTLRIASMPVANAISRSWERQADRASLELSGKAEAFIRAEVELARRNVSQIDPSPLTVFFLYTHPPVLERIRMGEEYRDRQ